MTSQFVDELARARAALAVIPSQDYSTWVDMAFAVKQGFGDAGFDIWDEWSRSAHNYSERAARVTWRSASASGGKTLASLFWLAERHGFDLQGSRVAGAVVHGVAGPDRQTLERRAQEAQREERKVRARHAAVAREAASIWQWARPVGPEHPYLTRKQLKATETLRELEAVELRTLLGYEASSEEEILTGRVLIVPVWRGECLSTLELIDEHGRKSSLAGGAKKGGYWMTLPEPVTGETASPMLIGEGMATVLSAHRATGWLAAAALSSGNLSEVAGVLRERFPDAGLIVLGDLGHGEESARQAARHVAAQLALPVFAPQALIDGSRPTDFNDMAVLYGSYAVRRLLRDVAFREVVSAHVTPEPEPIPCAEARADKPKEGSEMGHVKEEMANDAGSTKRRKAAPKKVTPQAVEESLVRPISQDGPVPQASAGSSLTDPPKAAWTRREIGEALYGLDDVPHEMKTLARHRFGAQIRMATPRENGGPYRGEVFNTEHYLIQEVATRSVVFHAKERMEFVSDRLKWMDENLRMNGAEVQIGYDGDRAKVYPWDRVRDQLERAVASLKKSACELGFGTDLVGTLDQLQANSWTRIREARASALAQSKERAAREPKDEPDR
ncbi:PriCT-2 domain-containing protein [Caballeronia mineralivorans]|jgi:putative DNA primase/helicase|uniref:PriCT-2 domain-containing protein n=1 Tax=Caballeronia mineralivorans TaxID=2010198 RepID=UPI0023F01BA4|nr:PriCT-2 domain-containing protein [Caballeronia mineralivorans]MDB5784864.1 replication protein [Caballeronia mineralivorans]MEA3099128.1 putative primase/helicase [Caballeronia mineralivorans]